MKLQTITKKALQSCNFVNNTFLYNSTGFEDVANSWIEAIHNKYQSTSLWKAEGNPTSCLRKVHFRRDQFKIIHSKFNSSAFSTIYSLKSSGKVLTTLAFSQIWTISSDLFKILYRKYIPLKLFKIFIEEF